MEHITAFNRQAQGYIVNMGQYFSNILNNVYTLWESIIGKNTANFISQYFKENYKFYLGISGFIGFVCVLKYFFKNDQNKANSVSSSSSLSKISASGKKIENRSVKSRLKSVKFMSETDQNEVDLNSPGNLKNDSTCSSNGQKRQSQKNKKKIDKFEEFDDQLQNQMQKAKTQRIVLQDSMSDKVFNQMYGVYMQT